MPSVDPPGVRAQVTRPNELFRTGIFIPSTVSTAPFDVAVLRRTEG